MDGYQYDAAGNLTNDGVHSYFYDAENRIIQVDGTLGTCSTATACYVYDAEGRRAQKTTSAGTVQYLYDLAGHVIAAFLSSGAWNRGEIYAGGKHLATYTNSTTYFTHADWLGTERARSTVSGASYETCTSLPFGDGLSCSGGDPSPLHFTGDERDAESGLDHTWFRQYASPQGRWLSPDPVAGSLGNPQTLNRYAYVMNAPTELADPLGLSDCIGGHSSCPTWLAGDPWADPSGEFGRDLFGGDPLGCRAGDFWGGDCAIENRMALAGAGIISPFDLAELASTAFVKVPLVDGRIPDWAHAQIIYPFAGLMDFYWGPSYGRAGGGGGGAAGSADALNSTLRLGNALSPAGGPATLGNLLGTYERLERAGANAAISGAFFTVGAVHIAVGTEIIIGGCTATAGFGCALAVGGGLVPISTGVGLVTTGII